MGFDPNANYTASTQAGTDITDTAPAGLFGVSQAVSTIPVTLKRGVGTPAGLAASTANLGGAPYQYTAPTTAPYESVLKMFYDLAPPERSALQNQMVGAGLLDPKKVVPGIYDDDSYAAWAKVVKTAARAEKTPAEVLNDLIGAAAGAGGKAGGGTAGAGGSARAPFSPVVTNPLDIRDTAQVTAKKVLGRSFTDDELTRFVTSFQGMETGAQATNYNATAAGGTTTASPNIGAAAANAARAAAPAEAGAHDIASVYDQFLSILKGG